MSVELEESAVATVEPVTAPQDGALMLDIGCGENPRPGHLGIDRKLGSEAFPLAFADGSPIPDNSVDAIVSSHTLEHFSHTQTREVLAHWISKLKPGGYIKIAVPNFEWIAKNYLEGRPINSQGYTMGGHIDGNDRHGAIFDRESLFELMIMLGLERIGNWKSDLKDCASLQVSLNLMGYKPASKLTQVRNTIAVLSAPRYGPISHQRCAHDAFQGLGVGYRICQGAYWHEVLSESIELQLERDHAFPGANEPRPADYIITCDFDTIFTSQDVLELYRLMEAVPEADAIIPVQSMRGATNALFGLQGKDGKPATRVYRSEFNRNLTKVHHGHFGLTIFRASTLRKSKRPWMVGTTNEQGRWGEGRVDPDIEFWNRWGEQGFTAFLANNVRVGHSAEVIMWPSAKDFTPIFQEYKDYTANGIPVEAQP